MVTESIACPHCGKSEPVVKHGVHRNQTARCYCKECGKTFTPKPRSRRVTSDKEQAIRDALAERLSIDAIARLLHCSKSTIYAVLRDTLKKTNDSSNPAA